MLTVQRGHQAVVQNASALQHFYELQDGLKVQFSDVAGSSSQSPNSVKHFLSRLLKLKDDEVKAQKLNAINQLFNKCFQEVSSQIHDLDQKQKGKCFKVVKAIDALLDEANFGIVRENSLSNFDIDQLIGPNSNTFSAEYLRYELFCQKIEQHKRLLDPSIHIVYSANARRAMENQAKLNLLLNSLRLSDDKEDTI